jgi:predicted amino acid-binding ACT domain protein
MSMSFKMQRVHVYHTEVQDEPGGIAAKLKVLAEAGVHLEYVYSQRSATKAGLSDLYVAPISGNGQLTAARAAGMHEVQEPIVMRVEGDDKAGLAGRLTVEWEKAGINLHGMVMSVFHGKFVGYVTFDSVPDANRAATILAELGTADTPPAAPVRNPNTGAGMKK